MLVLRPLYPNGLRQLHISPWKLVLGQEHACICYVIWCPTVSDMYAELIEPLAHGAAVVTPNRRLAAAVRRAFDLAQSQSGRAAWPAADALPWQAWLSRAYRDAFFRGATGRLLTTPQQERFLWWRVLEQSAEAHSLLGLSATAEAALEAWQLAHEWRLFPALNDMPLAEEGQAFLRWVSSYERTCAQHKLLDHARLADTMQDLVRADKASFAPRLILFGFDALAPQQRALLDALTASGVAVTISALGAARSAALVVQEPGVEQEIRTAALWARTRLTAVPSARIGVVVPDLTRLRSTVLRIFDEVLVPAALLQPGEHAPRPWNVSLGTALADGPLIHAALLILELSCGELSMERASVLLRSPFLGDARSEGDARALLDARLRRLGDPHLSLQSLEFHAAQQGQLYTCPQLTHALALLRARLRSLPNQPQPVSFWGPVVQALLAAMRWPGERELDSHEYQAFSAWKEMLAELAQLDAVAAPVTLRAAVEIVGRLARERVFQPETPAVPIQILGPLEAAQLEFDHLWVLGLTDETWPRIPRPNPLLPIELQRSRGLPRSSADWELGFARRMHAGWEAAAGEVLVSWHSSADDRVLSPSPLLGGLAGTSSAELRVEPLADWRLQIYRAAHLDETPDWTAAALPDGVSFAGGARVLQDQAACAFRAFAAHRLHAHPLEHPQEGLSPRDRGVVLHAALAMLWAELKSSPRLHEIDAAALQEVVQRSVAGALTRLRPRRSSALQMRFIELERSRLCALLNEWLELERARPPFEVIASEEDRAVNVAGLELKLRLDRVDRIGTSQEVLIDYKSGASLLAAWFGDRPDEPQLPLYAITRPHTPAALSFARVARGESGFVGLAAGMQVASGVQQFMPGRFDASQDWHELMRNWRSTLERLALSFRSGLVPVAPKKRAVTCSRCEFGLLCRVSELLDRSAPVSDASSDDE
jgi:probable DNA repair protein